MIHPNINYTRNYELFRTVMPSGGGNSQNVGMRPDSSQRTHESKQSGDMVLFIKLPSNSPMPEPELSLTGEC